MVIRFYETSDGEVLTKYVDIDEPVTVSKTVTAVKTKELQAVKVILKPVKTLVITRYKHPTKFVFITVPKFVYLTKLAKTIVFKVMKGEKHLSKEEVDKLRGSKEGRIVRVGPQPKRIIRAMV